MFKIIFVFFFLFIFASSLPCEPVDPWQYKEEEFTVDFIQKQIKSMEGEATLDAEQKKKILEIYQGSLENLQKISQWQLKYKEYTQFFENAPGLIKSALEEKTPKAIQGNFSQEPLGKLEQVLIKAQNEYSITNQEKEELQKKTKVFKDRQSEILRKIPALQKQVKETQGILDAKEIVEENAFLVLARRIFLATNLKNIQQELITISKELQVSADKDTLLKAQITQNQNKIAIAEQNIQFWEKAILENKKVQAERDIQSTQEEKLAMANAHPFIKKIVEENIQLATFRTSAQGPVVQHEKISQDLLKMREKLLELRKEAENIQEKIKIAGITNSIGWMLRKKYQELPDLRKHTSDIEVRAFHIPEIQIQILEWEDMVNSLENIEQISNSILSKLPGNSKTNELQIMELALKKQLEKKKFLLEQLLKDYNVYFLKLVEMDTQENQFVLEVKKFKKYVEERIFWIRSTTHIGKLDLNKTQEALSWFLQKQEWQEIFLKIKSSILDNFIVSIVFLVFLLFFGRIKFLSQRKLNDIAMLTGKVNTDSLSLSFQALAISISFAIFWPALIFVFSWLLRQNLQNSEFIFAISKGLTSLCVVFLVIEIIWAICLPKGLGEAHFRWNPEVMKIIRRNVAWFSFPALLTVFISVSLESHINDFWKGSLGRIFYLVGMTSLMVFLYNISVASLKIIHELLDNKENKGITITSWLWHCFALGFPAGLVLLASFGYYYTALQLTERFWKTLLLLLCVFIVYSFSLRWLWLLRRTLGMLKAIKIKALKQLKNSKDNASPQKPNEKLPVVDANVISTNTENSPVKNNATKLQDDFHIPSLLIQVRRFLKTIAIISIFLGLWYIWKDFIAAFNIFKSIHLWDMGKNSIMLSDLCYAIILMVITWAASKNLPGFLEVYILQKLNMEKGSRFAIVNITRYGLILFGVSISFNAIGITWSELQWLVAAFSVGLGFGLQEIFANFVSGLIIFFERPIRIGDVVTIGDTTGTVTQIHIRSTIILNWDRKELIVPNKEFITGRLLNWTLSDNMLRLIVPIGVEYGSDTKLVHEILLKIAQENSLILKTPSPRVIFTKFAESSLDFELRVYLPNVDLYLTVQDELLTKIDEEFRKAGISIAFPQRDIHIRSLPKDFKSLYEK
ncbi:MAG: mechanosensitive ion channel [Candidatus Brocadiae bacterium]|nr:mechanosensitive ion channel [Candidatus Brocadiia bacterium]